MTRNFHEKNLSEEKIFFLTGLPKSGTTWLMNILNSSEVICCLGEGRFFSSSLKNVPSLHNALLEGIRPWYEYIACRKKNWIGLDNYIITINRQNFLPSQILSKTIQEDLDTIVYYTVLYFFSKAKAKLPDIQLIGDKTPVSSQYEIKKIHKIFPKSKKIFLYRNVKDFIVSLIFHYWRSNFHNRPDKEISFLKIDDFLQVESFLKAPHKKEISFVRESTAIKLAKIWKELVKEAFALKNNFPDVFLVLSYEDLVIEPYQSAQKVFEFLGIDIPKNSLHEIIEKNSISFIRKTQNNYLNEHIRSGEIGNWKNYLNKDISDIIDQLIK